MPGKVLLDTDILLEIVKDKNREVAQRAESYLASHGAYTVSALTVVEVIRGLRHSGRDHEIPGMMSSFSKAEVLPLDLETAELAGRIHGDLDRAGLPIGRIDPLIAATALRHDLTLATGNVRHFERVRQLGYPLKLEDWRQSTSAPESGDP